MRSILRTLVAVAACLSACTAMPNQRDGLNQTRVITTLSKQFYYTGNMAFFETAEDSCGSAGYTLAYVESTSDVEAISKLTAGAMVSKLWVGGVSTSGEGKQRFDDSLWQWQNDQRITSTLWHSDVIPKQQDYLSRTLFKVISKKLDFDQNTQMYQFVCQRLTAH